MPSEIPDTLFYKRCEFTTYLPLARRYSPSHFWLASEEPGLWRIGFTKFATRMLGEIVDHHSDPAPGATVSPGQVIGWVEGFKALTELFCAASGEFCGANPALKEKISLISSDPYGEGWIYRVRGEPDATCVDAEGYRAILDAVIDGILESRP
ncbi:MAG: glycine cleavage system protein H [Verrucomicrobiae bacterium]